ncbi:MAG: histidine phosphatase family protein [Planctomycetes bacterium]|nr:histidine phosphatase family protein [Planctomycetota bacterium]MBU4400411.1 histidine phosphatase family protein [Planctomycetota bacterium]MCG2683692.1 histidine phosphatase family protein [Planctomycetales bacterium]
MLNIVLIRPGSTDYDVQQRIQGSLDIPLNEQGEAEAAQVAEQLRDKGLEAVYAPASQPSLETAEIIAEILDIKRKKLDRLHNLNQGLWQGMLVKDVRRKQPKVYRRWQEQPENVCPPEGEMLGEADERVRAAVVKIMKRRKEGTVGLVLPEPLFSLARRFISHCELGDLWKAPNGQEWFETLEVDAEEFLAAGV